MNKKRKKENRYVEKGQINKRKKGPKIKGQKKKRKKKRKRVNMKAKERVHKYIWKRNKEKRGKTEISKKKKDVIKAKK